MTKAELNHIATNACKDVLTRNQELIRERIKNSLAEHSHNNMISANDAATAAMGLSLTLIPELSAVVTAQIIADLGLIQIDNAE